MLFCYPLTECLIIGQCGRVNDQKVFVLYGNTDKGIESFRVMYGFEQWRN